jgi:hypothetical protein
MDFVARLNLAYPAARKLAHALKNIKFEKTVRFSAWHEQQFCFGQKPNDLAIVFLNSEPVILRAGLV